MFYSNTKTVKLRNDLSVITICFAKLYVLRRPWANENSFVSVEHRALYTMTYVPYIFGGDLNSP